MRSIVNLEFVLQFQSSMKLWNFYVLLYLILIPLLVFVEGLRNGWQIISPGKSFAVYAATGTEKAEWMAHINKCIDDLVAKSELIVVTMRHGVYMLIWVCPSVIYIPVLKIFVEGTQDFA